MLNHTVKDVVEDIFLPHMLSAWHHLRNLNLMNPYKHNGVNFQSQLVLYLVYGLLYFYPPYRHRTLPQILAMSLPIVHDVRHIFLNDLAVQR